MSTDSDDLQRQFDEVIGRLVFVAFNSKVIALDRDSGEMVWCWRSPKGTSDYVAVLLDRDRLIVSVQGYTYCLNPLSGQQMWANPLKGHGIGIPTLVSVAGASMSPAAAAEVASRKRKSDGNGGGGD